MGLDDSDESGNVRSLRKRPKKVDEPVKRRKSLSEKSEIEKPVEEIYITGKNDVSNFRPSSLETIYESPNDKNMGHVKLKRRCVFPSYYNPPKFKINRRKLKAKKIKPKRIGSNKSFSSVSLERVKKIIEELSDSENEENKRNILNTKDKNASDWYKDNVIVADTSFSEIQALSSDLAEMNVHSPKISLPEVVSDQASPCNNVTLPNKFELMELSFCNDFESPSRKLTENDKKRQHRRRSGRIQMASCPLDFVLEDETSVVAIAPAKSPVSMDTEDAKLEDNIQASASKAVIEEQIPTKDAKILKRKIAENKDTSRPEPYKKTKRKPRKERRVSGVTKPLYNNSFLNVSVDANSEFPTSPDVPSPCSLFKNLQLNSPGTTFENKDKTPVVKSSRRRSARLSAKFTGCAGVGSLWLPENNYAKSNHSPLRSPVISKLQSPILEETAPKIGSTDKDQRQKNLNLKLDNDDDGSPVVSGMFDSRARIVNGKKICLKSDKNVNLNSFKVQKI